MLLEPVEFSLAMSPWGATLRDVKTEERSALLQSVQRAVGDKKRQECEKE